MSSIIHILHTTDLHGCLSSAVVSRLQSLRASSGPASLLLDCGDAARSGNLGFLPDPVFPKMRTAGYDAMAMGNRETHIWKQLLQTKLRRLDFPILSSNLIEAAPPVLSRLVLTVDSVRLGLFALTPVMTPLSGRLSCLVSLHFRDPVEAARESISLLGSQVDLVVCLSHLGAEFDRGLASEAPGIHLILGGHDHSPALPLGQWAGDTLLARSSPHGIDIGEVTVEVTPGNRPRLSAQVHPVIQGAQPGKII